MLSLIFALFFCCLLSSVIAAGIGNASVSTVNEATPSYNIINNKTGLKNFVLQARDFALANGKEKALATFNDRDGPFVKGDLYIFAVDYEGYSLALPYELGNIGSNRLLTMDRNGFRYALEGRDIARNGGGFQSYMYENPKNNFQPAQKISYVTDVDGSYFIGAGIYSNASVVKPGMIDYFDIEGVLEKVMTNATSELNTVDTTLKQAAESLSSTGLTGPEAEIIEKKLCKSNPYSINCIAIATNGTIMSVQPSDYSSIIGKNILKEEDVEKMLTTERPRMSNNIQTIEGISAITFLYPVLDKNGNLIGGISILIRQEPFFTDITDAINSTDFQATITQKDGKIIYDGDPDQVGKYSLSDPLFRDFPSIIRLLKQAYNEKQGTGTYTFLKEATPDPKNPKTVKEDIVDKAIVWNTTDLYGNEWKVFINKVI